jgi:hypothetical protein
MRASRKMYETDLMLWIFTQYFIIVWFIDDVVVLIVFMLLQLLFGTIVANPASYVFPTVLVVVVPAIQ